jgi:hypothetical protein
MANLKRPRDPSQRAKLIVEIATGESDEPKSPPITDDAATRRGKARAEKLSRERRVEIARKAAAARWQRKG